MAHNESLKLQILTYLMEGKELTVRKAIDIFHTTELRKKISDLRADGYVISDEYVTKGDKRFKTYWINPQHRTAL